MTPERIAELTNTGIPWLDDALDALEAVTRERDVAAAISVTVDEMCLERLDAVAACEHRYVMRWRKMRKAVSDRLTYTNGEVTAKYASDVIDAIAGSDIPEAEEKPLPVVQPTPSKQAMDPYATVKLLDEECGRLAAALEQIVLASRGVPDQLGSDRQGNCHIVDCNCSNHLARAALASKPKPEGG